MRVIRRQKPMKEVNRDLPAGPVGCRHDVRPVVAKTLIIEEQIRGTTEEKKRVIFILFHSANVSFHTPSFLFFPLLSLSTFPLNLIVFSSQQCTYAIEST